MEKIIFEDLPSTKTPLNASNLNQIQENVEVAINELKQEIINVTGNFINVKKNSTQSISANTYTNIVWDIETYNDTNGLLVLNNNKISLTSGTHNLLVIIQTQNTNAANKGIYLKKYSNGEAEAIQSTNSAEIVQSIVTIVQLTKNESIGAEYYSSADSTIKNSPEWTNFKVILLN